MSRYRAAIRVGLMVTAALAASASYAQVRTINFDDLDASSSFIPVDYGSTPEIPVSIWSSSQDNLLNAGSALLWNTGYANLQNVAWTNPETRLVIRLNVQPDARRVRLDSFSVGGYSNDREMTWAVYDGLGTLLVGPTPVTAPGTTAKTILPNIAASGNGLILVMGGDAYNGGTDNIRFRVTDSLFDDGFESQVTQ